MNQGFGHEVPPAHAGVPHRPPARYLLLIDIGGVTMARLYLESRELVAEFDAACEEVAVMTRGLTPLQGVLGPEWDRALSGQNHDERRDATLYVLEI